MNSKRFLAAVCLILTLSTRFSAVLAEGDAPVPETVSAATPSAEELKAELEKAKKGPESPTSREGFRWKDLETLAIQDRGRLKPLETFAEESVLYVTGKRSWKGLSPVETVFGWLIAFDREWEDEPFIKIAYGPLKKAMGLDEKEQYFSPSQIQANVPFRTLLRDAIQKERRREKSSELEKKVIQLQSQRGLIEAIAMGQAITVLPHPEGMQQTWLAFSSLTDNSAASTYPADKMQQLSQVIRDLLDTYMARNATGWNQAVDRFVPFLRDDLGKAGYPSAASLQREVSFNRMRPFRLAWIFYSLAFVFLLAHLVVKNAVTRYLGLGTLLIAFGIHIYGFAIRCLIAGRPPVTNMYESVIWVSFGCITFGLLIWAAYKNATILAAGSVFAIVSLVLADNLPSVLDPSIQPLEPVLRSNFWLTIHVLTITASYAAFALALCIGNVALGAYLFRPQNTSFIQNQSLYMYRAMQIGVVLLAAGTILGGVWADYSWGRFWGWDPKEVWALIALLLYLAVLHGRFSGWLRGFGFVTSGVVSFLGVLMAWYGVNFVLGVGLHSYGFGTGGTGWVLGYIALQLAYIGAAYVSYRKALASGKVKASAIFPKGTA